MLAPTVLSYLRRTPSDLTLQHDNARAHTARLCTAFLQANNVPVIDRPALSPDMTPTEHVLDELERRVTHRTGQSQNLVQVRQAH